MNKTTRTQSVIERRGSARRHARIVALSLALTQFAVAFAQPQEAAKPSVRTESPRAGDTSAKPAAARPSSKADTTPARKGSQNGKSGAGKTSPPAAAPAGAAPAPPPAPAPRPVPAAGVPAGMIRLDFRGSDVDSVLQAFAMAYKWTVVKDPALTGPVTIIETNPMDQRRAFQVLLAVLEVRGFTALLDGQVLKVMPLKRAISSATTVRLPDTTTLLDRNQVITDVIPLNNAEAAVLAKDLVPLLSEGASIIGATGANALIITDAASNIDRVRLVVRALDKGVGNNELEIFRLKHVPAKKMAAVINDLFKQIAPRQPPPPMGQPGQPPQPGMPKAEARQAVAAVDDERTNSIIVVGSAENLKRVKEVVHKLDNELDPHNVTKVYEVKYADAQRLAQLVFDALPGDSKPPSQPSQASFNPFERRAQGTQATTSFSFGQTRIVADTRTNTLLITADEDTMKTVESLLEKLDKPVEYETTTFAIPLKNGNAEDMAYVLAQAFGTNQQSFNPFGGFFGFGGFGNNQRESRRDRRIRRRQGEDQNQRSDAGGGGQLALPETGFRPGSGLRRYADASLQPDLPPGAEQLAQFYYDPFGFGGGRRGSEATTGRTREGKYVNLLQLRGNVLVTPERNTNSLIITTTPENAAAVRELIAELDIEVKQVLMEAIVAEVSIDRSNRFGLSYFFKDLKNSIEGIFPVLPNAGALGADPLTAGLRYTILRGNFQAVVTAIGKDERIRILSTPRVFTANNQEAEIEVTDSIPYLRGTTIGFGGQTTSDTDFIDVGLVLNVTPRITSDGMVTVDVYQEDSNLTEFRKIGKDTEAPLTTQRITDTSVTLRDGDTLVLSGLQKTARTVTHHKIPILGDLPLLGNLFRSSAKRTQRTELVVFLTPRVMNNANEARGFSERELERLQKTTPDAKSRIVDPPAAPAPPM